MGLLDKNQIERINSLIDSSNSGSIPIIVYMQKKNDTIIYNRFDEELYFLKNGELGNCFKILTKKEFINSIDKLQKQGWKIL